MYDHRVAQKITSPVYFKDLINYTKYNYEVIHLAPLITKEIRMKGYFKFKYGLNLGVNCCTKNKFEGIYYPYQTQAYSSMAVSTNQDKVGWGFYSRAFCGIIYEFPKISFGLLIAGYYETVNLPTIYSEQSNIMAEPQTLLYHDRFSNYGLLPQGLLNRSFMNHKLFQNN